MVGAHAAAVGHHPHLGLVAVVADKRHHLLDDVGVVGLVAGVALGRGYGEVVPGLGIDRVHAEQLDHAAIDELGDRVDASQIVRTSITTGAGVAALDTKIADLFNDGIENSQTTLMVSNSRQIGLLRQAKVSLQAVLDGIQARMPIDLVQIDMTAAWDKLGEITGDAAPDELITQLFSQFCLGK